VLELAAAEILETPAYGQSADIVLAVGASKWRRSLKSTELNFPHSFGVKNIFFKNHLDVNLLFPNNFSATGLPGLAATPSPG
jgi:hypothetical protein